jgi:predicted ester cyclase
MLIKTISAWAVAGIMLTASGAMADTQKPAPAQHNMNHTMSGTGNNMGNMNHSLYPAMTKMHGEMEAIHTFYSMLSNPNDPDLAKKAAKVIAPNWLSDPVPRGGNGLEGFVKSMQAFGKMIPNLKWEPQEILKDGNQFIVRSIATGTPVQPFLGIQPTGKSFRIMTIDIHTVENGKIVRSYHLENWSEAMMQLR